MFSHQGIPARVSFNFTFPYRLSPNVNKWLYTAHLVEGATSEKVAEALCAIVCIKLASWDPKLICICAVCFLHALHLCAFPPIRLLSHMNPLLPQQVTGVQSQWCGGRRCRGAAQPRWYLQVGWWWLRWDRRIFRTCSLRLCADTRWQTGSALKNLQFEGWGKRWEKGRHSLQVTQQTQADLEEWSQDHPALCSTHPLYTSRCLFGIARTSDSWSKRLPFFALSVFCQRVRVGEVCACPGLHSPPLTPGLARLKRARWVTERSLRSASVPCPLPPLGAPGQGPPNSPQIHLALITLPAPSNYFAVLLHWGQGKASSSPATIPRRCGFPTRIVLMD